MWTIAEIDGTTLHKKGCRTIYTFCSPAKQRSPKKLNDTDHSLQITEPEGVKAQFPGQILVKRMQGLRQSQNRNKTPTLQLQAHTVYFLNDLFVCCILY